MTIGAGCPAQGKQENLCSQIYQQGKVYTDVGRGQYHRREKFTREN
jgi:hypothetical protein